MSTSQKSVTFSSVVARIANETGVNPTETGKRVRRHIRANHDNIAKEWTALQKKDKADGNRYPDMPASYAQKFIAGRVAVIGKNAKQ